jgi:ATP-dependent Lhr-like helicase
MQRWVYDQGWSSLHDAQEQTIPILLGADSDLIISAATAAGKTEAAFLPICSHLISQARNGGTGPDVLYLSPLKALINDQYDRLEMMCGRGEIPVHRWHGDVGSTHKARAAAMTGGVLLITPESLEAFLVLRGHEASRFFGRLKYIIIDELHSFLAEARGAQLQSLMNRVELCSRHRPPRVGLSATLGDMGMAQQYLRPSDPESVALVSSRANREIQLQLRGYSARSPANADPDAAPTDEVAIAEHLLKTLRGSDNLIFANSRRAVEIYGTRLAEICADRRLPNEFWPHHGSLSKPVREEVERGLKDRSKPVTAVCTSTLELGVDIGSVTSVAQIGPPPSVAALRQRLGRSGRRDDPAVVRLYVSEVEIDARTALIDLLRCDLVQAVAMVGLLVDGWLESPRANGLNLSTLVQQTLSLIAQRGGVSPADAHRVLCGAGPFQDVDASEYADLLRSLAACDLVMQSSDGTLLHGRQGERLVNHYSFYAAFASPEEWRLVAGGGTLGTMPIDYPIEMGGLLLFAGRRWRIVAIDTSAKVISLEPAKGGKPPKFGGGGPAVSATVREAMVRVFESEDVPAYLDRDAVEMLAQARATWSRHCLSDAGMIQWESDTFLLPWVGDEVLWAMTLALRRAGLDAEPEGPLLNVLDIDSEPLRDRMSEILGDPTPTALDLARAVENRAVEKWDWALGTELSVSSYARRFLDADAAWTSLKNVLDRGDGQTSEDASDEPVAQETPVRASTARKPAPRMADLEFCVVDVETTGFSPRMGDRMIEVAAVKMRADGTRLAEWSTLVNPERDIGPSHVHGISAGDVVDAPTFADVAGDLLALLDGAVVAAHNLRFDWGFLTAEFERAGHPLPALPSVCTLRLGTRVMPGLTNRRLEACCGALGVCRDGAHNRSGRRPSRCRSARGPVCGHLVGLDTNARSD